MLCPNFALSTIPDVQIKVYNDTSDFQNIVLFQAEDDLGLMFNNNYLLPVAWQVFPLPAKEEGVERFGKTIYSSSQEIGVTYNIENSDFIAKEDKLLEQLKKMMITQGESIILGTTTFNIIQGKLVIKRKASSGDKLQYSMDEKGGQHIDKLNGKNNDEIISCRNNYSSLVSIDFYKNDAKLATWKDLPNGDEAKFKLSRNLYVIYNSSIRQGQIITKSMIDNHETIDLTGYSHIEIRLIYDPDEGGRKKKWVINAS